MIDKSNITIKSIGRIIGNAYYDYQQVRIASTNRFRDIIRKRFEDIAFDAVEEKKDKDKRTYKKNYTDKDLLAKWNDLLQQNKIENREYDYSIKCWGIIQDFKKLEKKLLKMMEGYLAENDIYTKFLSKIRGIGMVISTNLIKQFGNCETYDNVSKLWAHTGNSVDENGKAPTRKKGEKTRYSPELRTMTWKISDSFLKLNHGLYRHLYDEDKEIQLAKEFEEEVLFKKYGKPYKKTDTKLTKLHAHNRALRKMRKIFLSHYWEASRTFVGLPIEKTYVEGVLKHTHIYTWKDALKWEEEARIEDEKKKEEKKKKTKKSTKK